ncbi:hypothetical protein DPMN_116607 [Dreissena polymorpha]|uniref:Uncharacterized protein n=1 Tax=Dreissena polymorpha TaxID=45954 RepID=A0A9D4KNZ7_DREPO|nr:hypothetical protein DPMN_116607 [Dreissena polymorpha]
MTVLQDLDYQDFVSKFQLIASTFVSCSEKTGHNAFQSSPDDNDDDDVDDDNDDDDVDDDNDVDDDDVDEKECGNRILKAFANSLDPDETPQNVAPSLMYSHFAEAAHLLLPMTPHLCPLSPVYRILLSYFKKPISVVHQPLDFNPHRLVTFVIKEHFFPN